VTYSSATTAASTTAGAAWESNKIGMSSLLRSPRSTHHLDIDGLNNNSNSIDTNFLIDRGEMFDPTIHLPHAPQDWRGYEPATPLSNFLMQRIGVAGQPITTAEYMRHALTHPLYGYYTNAAKRCRGGFTVGTANNADDVDDFDQNEWDNDNDSHTTTSAGKNSTYSSTIFGQKGDFVTAPELSSVFGHALCIWFMTVWQQAPLNRPAAVDMVEFGPGRGTLMADLLQLAHSSKLIEFGRSIRTVHFIEASQELRKEQKDTLTRSLGHLIELEFAEDIQKEDESEPSEILTTDKKHVNSIRIVWHDDFSAFEKSRVKDTPVMMVLQEFLDALPVHQFQKTEEGWRERMIDVASVDDGEDLNAQKGSGASLKPRLRQVLAPQVTPAVEVLLQSSKDAYEVYNSFPVGTVVEVCPDALLLVQDITKVLHESRGAALIIDYGEEGTADTLRAFSRHQQVPLTSKPGEVDVTADVDFFALKKVVSQMTMNKGDRESAVDIHAFGPVAQGEFLMKMGAGEMTTNAIEKPETTEEQAQAMFDALKFLVMPEHMGTKFKVMALARKRDGLFAPAGME
jgi:NADH dehydrogenase [ubiquinone] 1 alpha subcomplex assembly factor 7